MKTISLFLWIVALPSLAPLHAQRYIRQDERLEYELTVGPPDGSRGFVDQKPEVINKWWKPFIEKASISGYCFDLLTIPLFDRPELGDKAVILEVGGVGQLVQVIEIPPGGKTKWHGYGWEGEALFYVLKGTGQTVYTCAGGMPPNKYVWKKNSLFAIPVDHRMQHTNTDPTQPLRLLVVIGYAVNLYPYVQEELRSGQQNPASGPEERAATLARATYPGNFVADLREHPVTTREARGGRTAFFNVRAAVGHRTHGNVHISEAIGRQMYAHKHGNQPMFTILKGEGYDIWSQAANLEAYEAALKEGRAHRAPYKEGTLCGVPAGPHWHQHFSTGSEPLRYLAIVPSGRYEEKPDSK